MQKIQFQMNGQGNTICLTVDFFKVIGDHFVFKCKPGQDPMWKNLKGGTQNIVRSNLKFI